LRILPSFYMQTQRLNEAQIKQIKKLLMPPLQWDIAVCTKGRGLVLHQKQIKVNRPWQHEFMFPH
jgi:hypothetical protein